VSGTRDLRGQRGDSGALMSEAPEATFVLPLQEVAAHFASRNARSTEAEMGGSDNGNACLSIAMSTELGTGFPRFSGSQAESFFNKALASLPRRPSADTTMKGESADVAGGRTFFFFVRGLLALCCQVVLWSGLTWHQRPQRGCP
jgi:hypothetical protein